MLSSNIQDAQSLLQDLCSGTSGTFYERLKNFIADSRKDFNTRKGLARTACIKLQKVWISGVSEHQKVRFFKACVEPVLLYGSETWTLNKQFEKRLNGCYTRLLMKVQNIHWKCHPNLQRIYGNLPPIASVLAQRRARFAGHCMRAADQTISNHPALAPTTIEPWAQTTNIPRYSSQGCWTGNR